MNTLELKKCLKLQIDSINDKKLLNAIFVLLESKTDDIIYLSDKQKEEMRKKMRQESLEKIRALHVDLPEDGF